MNAEDVSLARTFAELYRSLGYQPLPSNCDPAGKKKPLCKFKHLWAEWADSDLFAQFPTTNLQVMAGRHWGLAVLDFDGPESVAYAAKEWPKLPRTWTVASGGGGVHHWFSIDRRGPERRKCFLWKGDGEHQGIELLCDGSLITAPPSIHLKTGKRYRFLAGHSPRDMRRPAPLPGWVLRLPEVGKSDAPTVPVVRLEPRITGCARGRHRFEDVAAAIVDKASVARDLWGLRFASNAAESDGWVSVHDFNREDRNPSARFCLATGGFWRPGEPVISFFSLGVAMGHYRDRLECLEDLAARFNVTASGGGHGHRGSAAGHARRV